LRAHRGSKGEPLGAFLAPLLGARQEVASKPAQRTREAVCASGCADVKKSCPAHTDIFGKNFAYKILRQRVTEHPTSTKLNARVMIVKRRSRGKFMISIFPPPLSQKRTKERKNEGLKE